MSFDAAAHLTNIKGKEYLEVKWRVVWFRQEHPADQGWGIETSALELTADRAVWRAQIIDPEGRVVATGTKSETPRGFADYIEKAETGAIGRALALLGYGTQWAADELDEGERIVDSPVARAYDDEPAPTPAPPPGLFDDQGRPTNLQAVAYQLAALGCDQREARTELLKRVNEQRKAEGLGKPETPEDWGAVLDAATALWMNECPFQAKEVVA